MPKNVEAPYLRSLKAGIWAYFLLLIFEGALRKWLLPGLATPLLIVRDPLALGLILIAWRHRLISPNPYFSAIVLIGIVGTFTALFFGHGNLPVALFGARVFMLHLPLMFVIGRSFNFKDVENIGRIVIWLALPMTVLVALQFYSPQSAWVNRGVGGDLDGAGFGGALGYFRPPGTFSFTNGNTLFYSLVACFLLYFWLVPGIAKRLLLACASFALVVAIPLSISRTLFFQVLVSVLFFAVAYLLTPKNKSGMIWIVITLVAAMLILSNTSFYSTATEAFSARYENANETEGGLKGVLGYRFLGKLIGAITEAFKNPLFGYGLGINTNIGAVLLPDNKVAVLSDFEWERLITELGPLLGLAVIFIRVGLTLKIAAASIVSLKMQHYLPWMLLSFGSLTLLQAQWAQPTSLGFCSLIGGLMVASFNRETGIT